MGNVYKVTEATIGETKRGFKIYKLQLNNSIWATKLVPLRKLERKYNKLFQLYEENNNSLNFLAGKYISISLNQSQYGFEFSSIISFDALTEFKELLDRSQGKAFSTTMNIYNFLKVKNYSINQDNSITLKAPYGNFNIVHKNGITVCYPNKLEDNCLSLDNIEIVYNQFYKNKVIDNGNPDRDSKYVLTPVAIVENRKIYHKYKGGTISDDNFDVLRIGDSLSEEQYSYILSLGIIT
jgi:hypothetical protein